jgi:molybdate transport system substrate-binding protein
LGSQAALAAELIILTNQGATPGVRELAAAFERATGHKVTVIQEEGAALEQRLNNGPADLITGNPGPIEDLVKNGKVVASTVTPFVLAGLGLSVRAGAPKPDISTVEAYKATLLAAKSIGYSRGCSGTNVGEGIAQLGLIEQLKAKTTFTTGGPVTDYLARGDFEIGIQQTNIMVGVPGTDYVGPLPGFLNKPCSSNVGVLAASKEQDAARAMIRFMISPEAAPLLRKTHVEPAKP